MEQNYKHMPVLCNLRYNMIGTFRNILGTQEDVKNEKQFSQGAVSTSVIILIIVETLTVTP